MLWLNYFIFRIKAWYHITFAVDKFAVAACPSCALVGAKKIRFLNQYQSPILLCPRCTAQWGVPPTVPYERWKLKGIEEIELEMQAAEDEKSLQREKELFKR